MPLVWEFTNELRVNVLKQLDTTLFDFRKSPALRPQLEAILSNPTLHYEQMIGELEALCLRRGPDQAAALNATRQLIDCVQILLTEDQLLTTGMLRVKMPDYAGIAGLATLNPGLDVFTLNHDVVFEEICRFHCVPYRDGFFDSPVPRYQQIGHFKTLTKTQMDCANLNFFDRSTYGLNLIKLHGSIDFFAVEDKNLYLKCQPPVSSAIGSHVGEVLRIEAHSVELSRTIKARGVGELFVKGSDGEMQFLRRSLLSGAHKFQTSFEQIAPLVFFEQFKTRLGFVNELDVIGCGFADDHISAVLKDWVSRPASVMTVFDPNLRSVPKPLASHATQIRIVNCGLTQYLRHFENRFTLSPMRWVRRRLLAAARENLRRRRMAAH